MMTDGAFYRAMMRWHFYAGIIVLPILALMAVTGALYLYKPEVEAFLYPVEIAARPAAERPQPQTADSTRRAVPESPRCGEAERLGGRLRCHRTSEGQERQGRGGDGWGEAQRE